MRRVLGWMGLTLLLCSFGAGAGNVMEALRQAPVRKQIREVRKQIEASMLVTGSITVDIDGSVKSFALDGEDKLPPNVVRLIRSAAQTWRFDPVRVSGQPAIARNTMSLLVVAKKVDDDQFELRLNGVSFAEINSSPDTVISPRSLTPPDYPHTAVAVGATGTAYVIVKVERTGKVDDAMIEQVNLGVVGTPKQMDQLRDIFAKAALKNSKRWTFVPPTKGEEANKPYWVVRVPVQFTFDRPRDRYGKWSAYVPGPRHKVTWDSDKESMAFSPDALPPGGVHLAGSGVKLLTPIGG